MEVSIELPREYGYVVLVLVAYAFLNLWMSLQVANARRKYKVPYPTMYAVESENKDAKLFNCVQVRARATPPAAGIHPIPNHRAADLLITKILARSVISESREGTRTRWR
jgi:hypothetical protein